MNKKMTDDRCKTLFWITLVSIVIAAILIILFAT